MAITIEPLGGLGNQLFVYATGLARALDLNTDLKVDLRNFRNYEWHNYELDSFRNEMTPVALSKNEEVARIARDVQRRFLRALCLSPAWGKGGEVIEESSRFDERVNRVANGTRLRGYFQSPKYFLRHADTVRASVRNIEMPSDWYVNLTAHLERMAPWAAVHVRRGNYVGLPNMGVTQDDYYRRALGLLRSSHGDIGVVVFSDDIEAARGLPVLQALKSAVFVQPPVETRPLESLLAMSMAHHVITANSSFSWWAAWLGDRPNRVVVCPRPWLDDWTYDDRDLFPPDWVTLGRM